MLAESGEHKFWDTQPVPKLSEPEAANYNGPITTPETCDRSWYVVGPFMERPYTMPEGFEWSGLDLNDPNQLEETYKLLEHHYVEDDLSRYRLLHQQFFCINFLPDLFPVGCCILKRPSRGL